jgi:hypothetical protein
MLAYLFVALAIAVRFLPHPLAFTPLGACLLFFGARGPRKHVWIPLALLAASDVVLTRFVYAYPLSWDHLVTWSWYAAALWLGTKLRENAGVVRIGAAALAASVSFFVVSNAAVWAAWGMYPKTLSGLYLCYAAGVPFFRRALEGDVLFTAAMFSTPAFLQIVADALVRRGRTAAV